MSARIVMIKGAAPSTGKNLLAAAMCHVYTRWSVQIAFFKAEAAQPDAGSSQARAVEEDVDAPADAVEDAFDLERLEKIV